MLSNFIRPAADYSFMAISGRWQGPARWTVHCAVVALFIAACGSAAAQPPVWTAQGAAPNTRGQTEGIGDGEVVGAIKAVAAHPTDPKTVYVGSVNGGIWKTTNATQPSPIWQQQTDLQKSLSIGALEFDPTDPSGQTLVAGVGRFSSLLSNGGALTGLLRTTDGGASWTPIDGGGTLKGVNVSGVAPRGATIVIAVNHADNPANLGIWRSTNTGATWTKISGGTGTGLPTGASSDLASDHSNRDRLFCNAGNNGLYRSVDAGVTWTRVSNGDMNTLIGSADNIKISVGGNSNVYIAIDGSGQLAGVYRSPDAGTSWTKMDLPSNAEGGIHPGGQGGTHLSLMADPNNEQIVYIGGDRQDGNFTEDPAQSTPNSIGARDYSGRLFRGDASKAAGSQWVHLTHSRTLGATGGGTVSGSAPHADSRGMKFTADGALLEVDDGGIYRRTNPQTNQGDWFSMNGNLQTTEFHAVAWDSIAQVIIGGAQDTGTPEQLATANARWQSISKGDGGVVAVDSLSTPGFSTRYASYYGLGNFRRRVYNSANVLQSEVFPNLTVLGGGAELSPQFYTPIKLNAITPRRLIIGAGNSVYESLDQGDNITEIGRGIVVNGSGPNPIAYGATGNPNMLYVGAGAQVFVRAAANPAALTASAAYQGGVVLGIAIDPGDPQTAYVVDSTNVYRTTNAGGMWTDITGNLPSLHPGTLRSVTYVRGSSQDGPVVGSDTGTFTAGGPTFSHWSPVGSGLPTVPVYHLEYNLNDRILLAGTLGRGAWTLKAASPVEPVAAVRAAALGQADAAQGPRSMSGIHLGNGVLIDPVKPIAFIMNAEGGIDAVSLANNEIVWHANDAAKPVGIADNRLIGQAESPGAPNSLKIVALDRATGQNPTAATVALPAGVRASMHASLQGHFAVRAEQAGADALVSWEYREPPKRGLPPGTKNALPPPPGRSNAPAPAGAANPHRGALRMKLASGEISTLNQVGVSVPRAPRVTELHGADRLPGLPEPQLLSADGRFVMIGKLTGDDRKPEEKYTLTVYDRTTAKPIGEFKSHLSLRPFVVVDSRVVFETGAHELQGVKEPRKLRAVDLQTGKELWSRPIRDVPRAAFPP